MQLNIDVRVGEGVDGTVVVLGAWCAECRTEVSPRDDGTCGWCYRPVVDEDTLPAREMLAQLRGEPVAPRLVVVGRKRGRPKMWTREKIIAAIQAFAVAYGRPPFSRDDGMKSVALAAHREFAGGWSEAVEQAGFPRPSRGRRKASGGTVGDPAVTGSADFPVVDGTAPRGDQVKEAAQGATPLPVPSHPEDFALELLAAVDGTVAA